MPLTDLSQSTLSVFTNIYDMDIAVFSVLRRPLHHIVSYDHKRLESCVSPKRNAYLRTMI